MSTTLTQTVKPRRRDTSQHITPDLIGFYKKRAHELRAEYYRDMWRAIWVSLTRIGRRRSINSLIGSDDAAAAVDT